MDGPWERENCAFGGLKGTKHHFYEDAYRILARDVPLVQNQSRGELFGVFDGIGSARMGRSAAVTMADLLINFYKRPDLYEASAEGVLRLLYEGNQMIHGWGLEPGTDRPLGGCVGTVVWLHNMILHTFHAGDTVAALIRDGRITKLTREHQTPAGAVFRYFGLGDVLQIETSRIDLEESDRILIVSDGVVPKAFSLEEAVLLVERFLDLKAAVKALIQQSRARGSEDDITAILIEAQEWD